VRFSTGSVLSLAVGVVRLLPRLDVTGRRLTGRPGLGHPGLGGRGSRNGQNLRLKGKGIPAKEAGDLYLTLNIELPRASDDTARALWQQLADHYAQG